MGTKLHFLFEIDTGPAMVSLVTPEALSDNFSDCQLRGNTLGPVYYNVKSSRETVSSLTELEIFKIEERQAEYSTSM